MSVLDRLMALGERVLTIDAEMRRQGENVDEMKLLRLLRRVSGSVNSGAGFNPRWVTERSARRVSDD